MKSRNIYFFTILVTLVTLAFVPQVFARAIELKAVCFLPKNHQLAVPTVDWVKRVNDTFKDQLEVKYIGGPEITASKEQIQALKNRLFDINFNVTSYYAPLAPELNAFQLSKLMPWEEREKGFYDYMKGRHEKIGVFYLGRWLYGSFYIWTKEPVSRINDLKGRKLRTGPMYIYFMNKLDVSSVSIKPTDVYTALERGTVDGFAWPILGARDLGWTDSCKYLIDHPFYGMDGTIIFNMDSWKKLPKGIQDKLVDLTAQFESDMVDHFKKEIGAEREMLQKVDVEFVKFSEEEGKKYIQMADDAYWEVLQEKVPDLVSDLRRITGN